MCINLSSIVISLKNIIFWTVGATREGVEGITEVVKGAVAQGVEIMITGNHLSG